MQDYECLLSGMTDVMWDGCYTMQFLPTVVKNLMLKTYVGNNTKILLRIIIE
jgi:hypothetical protein